VVRYYCPANELYVGVKLSNYLIFMSAAEDDCFVQSELYMYVKY
jgi:hypothetical protein